MIYTNESKPKGSFRFLLDKHLMSATSVDICVGYCAWKTVKNYIPKLVRIAKHGRVRLILGMYRLDGALKKNLYDVLLDLHIQLKNASPSNTASGVYITKEDCHAKIWNFVLKDNRNSLWVGSNNFSEAGLEDRLETCVEVTGKDLSDCQNFVASLVSKNKSVTIDKIGFSGPPKKSQLSSLPFCQLPSGVSVIGSVELPLNVDKQPRSGLNLCFGSGRMNPKGIYTPRPWYEIEISSDSSVTSNPIYPKPKNVTYSTKSNGKKKINHAQIFSAYLKHENTYRKITLKTYSDNNKAMASAPRSVLGEFIKGNLEDAKALQQGGLVTSDVLQAYGRESITLTKLSSGEYIIEF